jgi:hypothetical protein
MAPVTAALTCRKGRWIKGSIDFAAPRGQEAAKSLKKRLKNSLEKRRQESLPNAFSNTSLQMDLNSQRMSGPNV